MHADSDVDRTVLLFFNRSNQVHGHDDCWCWLIKRCLCQIRIFGPSLPLKEKGQITKTIGWYHQCCGNNFIIDNKYVYIPLYAFSRPWNIFPWLLLFWFFEVVIINHLTVLFFVRHSNQEWINTLLASSSFQWTRAWFCTIINRFWVWRPGLSGLILHAIVLWANTVGRQTCISP
jgi:hypothetical protein